MGKAAKVLAALIILGILGYAANLYIAAKSIHVEPIIDPISLVAALSSGQPLHIRLNVSIPKQPIPATICIDEVRGQVLVNREPVATFHTLEGFCVSSGSWKIVDVEAYPSIGSAVKAALEALREGKVVVRVEGEAEVPPTLGPVKLPLDIVVPFSQEEYMSLGGGSSVVKKVEEEVSRVVSGIREKVQGIVEKVREKLGIERGYVGEKRVHVLKVEWLCEGSPCIEAKPGITAAAVVVLEGYAPSVTVKVRMDRAFLPDKTVAEKTLPYINGTAKVVLTFRVESGLTVRGYFVEVDWPGGKWTQPRDEELKVIK